MALNQKCANPACTRTSEVRLFESGRRYLAPASLNAGWKAELLPTGVFTVRCPAHRANFIEVGNDELARALFEEAANHDGYLETLLLTAAARLHDAR